MRSTHVRLSKICAALLLSVSVVACGGGGGGGDGIVKQALSAVLDFLSGGAFKDLDSLVVALQGDQLQIEDFGQSELGTNPAVLPLHGALVDGISCDDSSCTGQVLVPTITNGKLESFTREAGTITRDGDSIVIASPSRGSRTFTSTTTANPGANATLNKDATCAQWWAALRGHTYTWVSAPDDGVPMPNGTLTFSEVDNGGAKTMRWAMNADPMPKADTPDYDWYPSRSGEVTLTDQYPDLRVCRIALMFDPNRFLGLGNWTGFDMYWSFGYSLSGDRLELILNSNNAAAGSWVFKAAN